VSLLAFEKGRTCAYNVGCSMRHRLRRVVSKDNPSDWDSRRWEPVAPVRVHSAKLGTAVVSGSAGRSACSGAHSPAGVQHTHKQGPTALQRQPLHQCPKVFLEIFSGSGNLTQAVRKAGLAVGPSFELRLGAEFDLTRRSTQQVLRTWLRSGRV